LFPSNPSTNEPALHAPESRRFYGGVFSPRLLLRPCSLGLIALALCVFLWGYGYKLSLYHAHRNPVSRASVAKLWVESKSGRNLQILARAYALAVPDAPRATGHQLPLREVGRTFLPATPRSLGAVLDSLLPSRAPPAPLSSGPLQA
jgi:hypothetical protein